MKKHTQTRQAQLLLGLVGAIALLVGASLFSSSSNLGAAILRTSNDPKTFFEPVKTDSGCTAWLVHQHTGPNFTFWNANKTVALAQSGTTLAKDLKLTVPAGNYIKYVAYSGADNHALYFKLTDAQNQQVGGWYVFSAANNKAPYRFDGSVDTNNAVNIYFKAGHPLQSFNFLSVAYCPVQMSSSSAPTQAKLAIISETSPSNVELRADFTHEVIIKNTGTLTASGVKVNVPIPRFEPISYFIFSGANNANCLYGQTGMIVCDLKSVAAGETKTIQIKFRPTDESTCNKTTLPASVAVTAANAQSITGTSFSHTVNCTSTNSTFTIGINGPATQAYSPGDQDVVMANVTMYAGTTDVTLKDLFIAVQGTKYAYGNLGGVELRSKTTGQTIPGIIPDTVSSTWRGQSATLIPPYYTIYRFDDVPVHGQDTYEFRVDVGTTLVNDNFRVHICGESRYMLDAGRVVVSPNGCDFGGLVFKSTIYQMDIVETASNSPVADVRPRGTISGSNFYVTAVPVGTLTVSKSATSLPSRQLLGNTQAAPILRVKLHAENELIQLTQLVFTASGANADRFLSDIDKLAVVLSRSPYKAADATVGACANMFVPANSMCALLNTGNNPVFSVAPGTDLELEIDPFVKSDVNGSMSGDKFALTLTQARGFGTQSATPLLVTSPVVGGVSNTVVHSKLITISNADLNPDGTAIPTGRTNIGGFQFRADANTNSKNGINKVVLKRVKFAVSAQNVLMSTDNVYVQNPVDVSARSSCSVSGGQSGEGGNNVTGNFFVTCDNINSLAAQDIGPGEFMNLYLSMMVLNPKIVNTSSSLQVRIEGAATPQGSVIEWFDKDFLSSTLLNWADTGVNTVYSTLYRS